MCHWLGDHSPSKQTAPLGKLPIECLHAVVWLLYPHAEIDYEKKSFTEYEGVTTEVHALKCGKWMASSRGSLVPLSVTKTMLYDDQ